MNLLIGGLAIGALYALVALGIVLIARTTDVVNFGQGELLMIGGYAFVFTAGSAPLQMAAVLVVGAIGGSAYFVVTHYALRRAKDHVTVVIGTLALMLILRAITRSRYTDIPRGAPAWLVGDATLPIGSGVATISVIAIGITLVVAVSLILLLARTLVGKAMTAVAEDGRRASLSGIPVTWMLLGSWLLGGALAGLAGLQLASRVGASPDMGTTMLLPGFIAAIVGGFHSLRGALLGGLFLGVLQSYTVFHFGGLWRDAITFFVLLGILLIRPTGLVAAPAERRV